MKFARPFGCASPLAQQLRLPQSTRETNPRLQGTHAGSSTSNGITPNHSLPPRSSRFAPPSPIHAYSYIQPTYGGPSLPYSSRQPRSHPSQEIPQASAADFSNWTSPPWAHNPGDSETRYSSPGPGNPYRPAPASAQSSRPSASHPGSTTTQPPLSSPSQPGVPNLGPTVTPTPNPETFLGNAINGLTATITTHFKNMQDEMAETRKLFTPDSSRNSKHAKGREYGDFKARSSPRPRTAVRDGMMVQWISPIIH